MATETRTSSFRNRLLRALSSEDAELLFPLLCPMALELRQELELPDRPISRVYFIEEGIASIISPGQDRDRVEIGLVGREGMTGLMVLFGNHQSPNSTVVQMAGTALTIEADAFRRTLTQSETLRQTLLKYAQVLLIQTSQTAVANARLTLEGRLARWLLMAQDRWGQSQLPITHEFLAAMLGVRRAGVTEALHSLEGKRGIRSMRGELEILDRKVIERQVGALYGVPEAEYERLFEGTL